MGEPSSLGDRFEGWMPYRVDWGEEPMIRWCYTGDLPFTDPFFEETISCAFRRPFALLFERRTTFPELAELCDSWAMLQPRCFIFHTSRCGSTLVSRTLAQLPELSVLSEPPALERVLRSGSERQVDLIVRSLGRRRFAEQLGSIFKLDCWSILHVDRLRRCFPDVPCFFVYRDPVEVLVSQMVEPGAWTLPEALPAALFGIDTELVETLSRPEYCARLLHAIYEAGVAAVESGDLRPINYNELPQAIFDTIAGQARLSLIGRQMADLRASTLVHAKRPNMSFESDVLRKRKSADGQLRTLADRWAGTEYARLEACRSAIQQKLMNAAK